MNAKERIAALESISKLLKEHATGYVLCVAFMEEDGGQEDTIVPTYSGGLVNARGCAQYLSEYLDVEIRTMIAIRAEAQQQSDEGGEGFTA